MGCSGEDPLYCILFIDCAFCYATNLLFSFLSGRLNVLQAAVDTDTVRRLIMTSGCVAVTNGYNFDSNITYTELHWTDPEVKGISVHGKSKALAERAAWDFVAKHENMLQRKGFSLTVLNPSPVIGPSLNGALSHVMQFCKALVQGDWPMVAPIHVVLIDVRDVARAHLVAMKTIKAANQRYILANRAFWGKEVAEMLNNQGGYRAATIQAPYVFFSLYCLRDRRLKMMQAAYGKEIKVDNSKMRNELNIELTPIQQSMRDMVCSMQERGFIARPK